MNLVFKELLDIENRLHSLELKMAEPYDENNDSYHQKVIKDYTTLQDLYSHKGGYTYKGEISRVLKGLGFLEDDFDKTIYTLSGGQKTRVSLCKLLLKNPDILLLDEPTNHLDLEAIEWLEDYLKNYKGTVLVISHDRFFLDTVTNNTFDSSSEEVNCKFVLIVLISSLILDFGFVCITNSSFISSILYLGNFAERNQIPSFKNSFCSHTK